MKWLIFHDNGFVSGFEGNTPKDAEQKFNVIIRDIEWILKVYDFENSIALFGDEVTKFKSERGKLDITEYLGV